MCRRAPGTSSLPSLSHLPRRGCPTQATGKQGGVQRGVGVGGWVGEGAGKGGDQWRRLKHKEPQTCMGSARAAHPMNAITCTQRYSPSPRHTFGCTHTLPTTKSPPSLPLFKSNSNFRNQHQARMSGVSFTTPVSVMAAGPSNEPSRFQRTAQQVQSKQPRGEGGRCMPEAKPCKRQRQC